MKKITSYCRAVLWGEIETHVLSLRRATEQQKIGDARGHLKAISAHLDQIVKSNKTLPKQVKTHPVSFKIGMKVRVTPTESDFFDPVDGKIISMQKIKREESGCIGSDIEYVVKDRKGLTYAVWSEHMKLIRKKNGVKK